MSVYFQTHFLIFSICFKNVFQCYFRMVHSDLNFSQSGPQTFFLTTVYNVSFMSLYLFQDLGPRNQPCDAVNIPINLRNKLTQFLIQKCFEAVYRSGNLISTYTNSKDRLQKLGWIFTTSLLLFSRNCKREKPCFQRKFVPYDFIVFKDNVNQIYPNLGERVEVGLLPPHTPVGFSLITQKS